MQHALFQDSYRNLKIKMDQKHRYVAETSRDCRTVRERERESKVVDILLAMIYETRHLHQSGLFFENPCNS